MKFNKLYILTISVLFSLILHGQVGINTDILDGTTELTVFSNDSNYPIIKVSDTLNNTIFVVNENGYVGIGNNIVPKVRLDFRGDSENSIAVGTTTMDAKEAEAGAIRYNSTSSLLEYSNGESWLVLKKAPTKTNVLAVARSANFTPVVADDQPLKGWSEIRDLTNSFNNSTGIFTAPDSGIYSVTTRLLIKTTETLTNGSCELNIFYTAGGILQGVKNVYPIIASTTGIDIPVFNKVFLFLNTGDTVYVSFYSSLFNSPSISDNDQLNYINIVKM